MAASREARLGEDVEDAEAHLRVVAIGRGRLGTSAMARGGGARVPSSSWKRERERSREREESEGAVRGGRPRPYPRAAATGGERVEREQLRPWRGVATERRKTTRGRFCSKPPGFSFSFLSGPFPFVFLFY